ncbi:MAG: hypothetical protein AAF702_06830 [Chloroflexota bacterium]
MTNDKGQMTNRNILALGLVSFFTALGGLLVILRLHSVMRPLMIET